MWLIGFKKYQNKRYDSLYQKSFWKRIVLRGKIVLKETVVCFGTDKVKIMNTVYGYCRISRPKQNIERQVRNILAVYPDAVIVREVFTGTKFQGRKELEKILRVVQPSDKIVFDSVSRMSRNAEEGCIEYEKLFDRGISLEFLKEPHINSDVYRQALQRQVDISLKTGNNAADNFMGSVIEALNQYMVDLAKEQIRIAFGQAEKEVKDLHQRTQEGIKTARLDGKQIGLKTGTKLKVKKADPAKEKIMKYSVSFGGVLNDKDCIKLVGISRNTFYKYKKEISKKMEEKDMEMYGVNEGN